MNEYLYFSVLLTTAHHNKQEVDYEILAFEKSISG